VFFTKAIIPTIHGYEGIGTRIEDFLQRGSRHNMGYESHVTCEMKLSHYMTIPRYRLCYDPRLPNTVVYDREGRDHGSGRTDDLGITFFWPTQFIDRDNSNPQHQAMVDEFVGVLESFLGTKRVNISLAERWEQCPPSEVNGKPLKQYLSKVGIQFTLIWK
jgi:hypothetical protein